jgi:hypothetical protein
MPDVASEIPELRLSQDELTKVVTQVVLDTVNQLQPRIVGLAFALAAQQLDKMAVTLSPLSPSQSTDHQRGIVAGVHASAAALREAAKSMAAPG